jgi:uncharacterized protein DUF3592
MPGDSSAIRTAFQFGDEYGPRSSIIDIVYDSTGQPRALRELATTRSSDRGASMEIYSVAFDADGNAVGSVVRSTTSGDTSVTNAANPPSTSHPMTAGELARATALARWGWLHRCPDTSRANSTRSVSAATFYLSVFTLAAAIVFAWAAYQALRRRRAQSWPTVEGHLREARFEGERLEQGERSHATEARYVYDVGGSLYTGSRVYFGDELQLMRHRKRAQSLFRHIRGDRMTVYYNPANPDDAVLDVSVVPRLKPALGLALTYLVLAGLFYWLADQGIFESGLALRRSALLAGFLALSFWAAV